MMTTISRMQCYVTSPAGLQETVPLVAGKSQQSTALLCAHPPMKLRLLGGPAALPKLPSHQYLPGWHGGKSETEAPHSVRT